MVLAEMAEKAVAEMGRFCPEATAKKLRPPIAADWRLAMEMAPRIIFGGGWCRTKRYAAAAAAAALQIKLQKRNGRRRRAPPPAPPRRARGHTARREKENGGQTKGGWEWEPALSRAGQLIFANSNNDVETKQQRRGSMLPCTAGYYC